MIAVPRLLRIVPSGKTLVMPVEWSASRTTSQALPGLGVDSDGRGFHEPGNPPPNVRFISVGDRHEYDVAFDVYRGVSHGAGYDRGIPIADRDRVA